MLPILGAMAALEAAAILMSAGLCVFEQSQLRRRHGKRFKGDVAFGNGYPAGRKGVGGGGGGGAGHPVIFASGGMDGGDDGGGCRGGCGGDCGGECGGGCGVKE